MNFDISFNIATQKQKNTEYNNQLSAYNKAQADFQKALDDWRNKNSLNTLNVNGVSSSEIQQRLTLGREPSAKLSVLSTDGTVDNNFFWVPGWNTGATNFKSMMQKLGMDSSSSVILKWPANKLGNVTVQYSNLHNSTYIGNDGQTHHISNIRVNYKIDSSNTEHGIALFSDITDGLSYLATTGVTATYTLYGDDGKPLDLSSGHAYITVTSLNRNAGGVTETVKGENGTKAYAVLGSSVSNHNGMLYADQNNDPDSTDPTTSWHGKDNWDTKGPDEYYGAGLIEANSNDFTIRYSELNFDSPANIDGNTLHGSQAGGPWVTITTDIMATPGPKYDGPKPPQQKKSTINYHYDVILIR